MQAVKQQVLAYFERIRAGLESGSLEIEMYHDNAKAGHSEVNFILTGDYLAAYYRVHLTGTQDWPTHL